METVRDKKRVAPQARGGAKVGDPTLRGLGVLLLRRESCFACIQFNLLVVYAQSLNPSHSPTAQRLHSSRTSLERPRSRVSLIHLVFRNHPGRPLLASVPRSREFQLAFNRRLIPPLTWPHFLFSRRDEVNLSDCCEVVSTVHAVGSDGSRSAGGIRQKEKRRGLLWEARGDASDRQGSVVTFLVRDRERTVSLGNCCGECRCEDVRIRLARETESQWERAVGKCAHCFITAFCWWVAKELCYLALLDWYGRSERRRRVERRRCFLWAEFWWNVCLENHSWEQWKGLWSGCEFFQETRVGGDP